MTKLNIAIDRIISNERLCYKSDEEYFYNLSDSNHITDGTRVEDIITCFQNRFKDSTDFLDCKVSWVDNYTVDYNAATGICTSKSGIRVKFTKSNQLKMSDLNNAVDKIIDTKDILYKSEGECFYNIEGDNDVDDITDGTRTEDIIACFQNRFKDSTISFTEEYITDCNLVISKCGILVKGNINSNNRI